MRLLILSDIHSNLEALEACLAAASAWDRFVNLGDTVGYAADPNAVISRVRPFGGLAVRGNHDHAVLDLKQIESFNPVAAAGRTVDSQPPYPGESCLAERGAGRPCLRTGARRRRIRARLARG